MRAYQPSFTRTVGFTPDPARIEAPRRFAPAGGRLALIAIIDDPAVMRGSCVISGCRRRSAPGGSVRA